MLQGPVAGLLEHSERPMGIAGGKEGAAHHVFYRCRGAIKIGLARQSIIRGFSPRFGLIAMHGSSCLHYTMSYVMIREKL